MNRKLLLTTLLATSALAKTDLKGCVSYETIITVPDRPDIYPYGSLIWYVPDTGELCEFLDCGGGRAPPKTTVPGCGSYEGTETYSPKFIDPKTLGQAPQTAVGDSSSAVATDEVVTTESPVQTSTAEDSESESETESVEPLTGLPTLTTKGSDAKTTAAPATATSAMSNISNASSAASASDGAASAPAPSSSSVSTAAGAMPTAGGMLALAAGAAVYAGMI